MNICGRCNTELSEEDLEKGCPKCGSKVFKFVNTKAIAEKKQKEKEKGLEQDFPEEEISMDENSIESIKVEDKGVYEVNLSHILEGNTDVYSDTEGNYAININSLLKKSRKEKDDGKD